MHSRYSRPRPLAAAAFALLLMCAPAGAQQLVGEATTSYEREVFHYGGAGRVDPFRTLISEGSGVRVEDLALRGIMHHLDPAQSVAVLTQAGTDRRIQARIGQRIGALRILAIYPDRVEVVVEELGVARRETLRMERSDTSTEPNQESSR